MKNSHSPASKYEMIDGRDIFLVTAASPLSKGIRVPLVANKAEYVPQYMHAARKVGSVGSRSVRVSAVTVRAARTKGCVQLRIIKAA